MSRSLHLTVTGPDHPDLFAEVMAALAREGVALRDLHRSVLTGRTVIGVALAVDDGAEAAFEARLAERLDGFGCGVALVAVPPPDPDAGREGDAAARGASRWVATLLARRLDADQLARVAGVLHGHALRIDAVRRLSDPAAAGGERGRASVEFALRGDPADADALRADCLAASAELGIDVAVQRDDVRRRDRRLVAFDMDSTLIEAEVIDELAREAGIGAAVAAITERAMRGELDFAASFRERVALLEGLDAAVLETVAARLTLSEGAERLLAGLRRLGARTVILSGGFRFFAERVAERLGIDWVHANTLEIVDGRVTGRAPGAIVDGARKAALLREIAEREGIALDRVVAVGDGANDLPMLSLAGLGVAFRAKPVVREAADQSVSAIGLDGILYLLGVTDAELE